MARPYEHLRRAGIATLLEANQAERERLQRGIEAIEAERATVSRRDFDLPRRIGPKQRILAGTTQVTALLEDVQAMNVELHVRDTPALVAELGARAD